MGTQVTISKLEEQYELRKNFGITEMLRNFSSLDSPLGGNNNREEGEEESF